ncbi:MAG: hypothetical protein LAO06_13695 [Acidobacteriia bacterium]|nr:hypothetical protein [Terriglobia bacterium]
MKLLHQLAILAVISSSAVTLCSAQSLGDVARQEKSRKASSPAAKRPTVTNDDLGSRSEESAKPPEAPAEKDATTSAPKSDTAKLRNATAAEFKVKIKERKQRVSDVEAHIKDLQREMDRWKTSNCLYVRYADNPYKNACDVPQKLTAEYERSKTQLEKSRAALEALQEEARRSGFGTSVYDPD